MKQLNIWKLDKEKISLWPRRKQSTYNSFDIVILHINSVHFKYMIAEIKGLKSSLLAKQHNKGTSGPIQTFTI